MLPFASCYSEGSGTGYHNGLPSVKGRRRSQEVSGLWLWHGARPGENERQKASQSWATVTSVRKALAGQPNLPRMPRTRDHDVATAGHPGNVRLYAQHEV